ncbi:hypothetical protein CC80DRAFT_591806 [Byssothecium circinans]|uniref:Zn(2)-C6 fungal-type domain-containing protein n=1 Tax=Byssothecium circinans TaxID=147558 RepID=A0A6A5U2N4_9PLEO|nr:hypothetical protein CC80DRAFT_591806 [Byssothecium circinans]
MPPRHSCDRCRQQKVRCLRDELHSSAQPLSSCQRCVNASVACVYSLRRRPRISTEGNASTSEDSNMGGLKPGPAGGFFQDETLSPHFGNLDDCFPSLGDGSDLGFNSWDTNLHIFTQTSPLALAEPMADITMDRELGVNSSDDEGDHIDSLFSQLTALSQRAIRASRALVQQTTPLAVSSPPVNQALEDTNTFIRIVNKLTAGLESDGPHLVVDDGLIFLALASHHRLLSFFKAICDSIHLYLETTLSKNEQPRSDLRGDAQLVMILQLLMHLINRIDQNLFQNKLGTESGGLITPITPTSHMPLPLQVEDGRSSYPRGLDVLAEGIFRTIPNRHVELRHVIQELQMRIEHCEFQ